MSENQGIEKLLDELDALVESNPIPTLMWIDIRKLIITAYDFGFNDGHKDGYEIGIRDEHKFPGNNGEDK